MVLEYQLIKKLQQHKKTVALNQFFNNQNFSKMQKKIFKLTTNASVSTTKKTKLTETNGNYTLEGEYRLGDKEPKRGSINIKATGIVYIESVDFVEEK